MKISEINRIESSESTQNKIENYPSEEDETHSFSRRNGVLHWSAWDKQGEPVQIESAVPKRTYYCPTCNGEMVAVKGQIKAHHFRHKSESKDGSDGITTGGCGGEGARHFRVKTFANRIFNSVRKKNRNVKMVAKLEKRIDQYQPDITVFVNNVPDLAIEIVDSNPPSQEKLEKWGDKMLVIDISEWTDREIGDASRLSGLLLPYMCDFSNYTDKISKQFKILEKHFDSLVDQRYSEHENALETLGKELVDERLKIHNLEKYPGVFTGHFSNLSRHGGIGWGVSVKTTEYGYPRKGDIVIIMTKERKTELAVIGDTVKESDFVSYYTLYHRRNAPEITRLLVNLE